jgi:hypothetical protein
MERGSSSPGITSFNPERQKTKKIAGYLLVAVTHESAPSLHFSQHHPLFDPSRNGIVLTFVRQTLPHSERPERAVRGCAGGKFPVRPPDALIAISPIESSIPDLVLSSGPAIVTGWKSP